MDPVSGGVVREKVYVYGAGQLLAERTPVARVAGLGAGTPGTGAVTLPLAVFTGSRPEETYALDIRTAEGAYNHLTGIALNAENKFTIGVSEVAAGQTNYLRIKPEGAAGAVYSAPVALRVGSPGAGEANQVRTVSVHRNGTDIVIRWSLGEENGKKTKWYFQRSDTGSIFQLTPQALNAPVRQLVLNSQALSSPCGEFYPTQVEGGGGESPAGPRVPNPAVWAGLENPVDPCLEGGGPVPAPVPRFADQFHHRDHLGSLRVVTGEAGEKLSAHDYYPFGQEMGGAIPVPSCKKFTGHERDETTGLDYMLARYYAANLGRFLSVDPVGVEPERLRRPGLLNGFSYAANSPLLYIDSDGQDIELAQVGRHKAVRKLLVKLARRPTSRAMLQKAENSSVKVTFQDKRINSADAITQAKQQGGSMRFGTEVPTTSTDATTGKTTHTAVDVSLDMNAIQQAHPDPTGVTSGGHALHHVNDVVDQKPLADIRKGDQPTSGTGPAAQTGEAVAQEKEDLSKKEAKQLVDKWLK